MTKQPTPKQLAALRTEADRLIALYPAEIAAIKRAMLDFEVPAQRSINCGFARMGVDRFTRAGDGLWEMIVDHEAGWEYQRPPARLVARWAGY